jgi:23S rRNA pseudouridine1911/1915/1917 synthase
LVHRLDRPAGGVMAFARTSKAAARLAEQMQDGRFHKEYLCVCQGQPQAGCLEHWLTKDERTNTVTATPEQRPGAQWAALELTPLQSRDGLTLCRVNLLTGRPHQIRVQMASTGHPLWGDQRYNPVAKPGEWLALWSTCLTLEHPTRKETLRFDCLPRSGIWDRFDLP